MKIETDEALVAVLAELVSATCIRYVQYVDGETRAKVQINPPGPVEDEQITATWVTNKDQRSN